MNLLGCVWLLRSCHTNGQVVGRQLQYVNALLDERVEHLHSFLEAQDAAQGRQLANEEALRHNVNTAFGHMVSAGLLVSGSRGPLLDQQRTRIKTPKYLCWSLIAKGCL